MARIIVLDSSPTGIACDNPKKPAVDKFLTWAVRAIGNGRTQIIIPEIADYEIRRQLLANVDGTASIHRLDELTRPGGLMVYLQIKKEAMRRAARIWADARRGGYATASPDALDGDVILAAQSLEYVGQTDEFWLATSNKSDLCRYVGDRAVSWETIIP